MKQLKFPLNKIVEVEWSDACGYSKWDGLEEYEELAPMPCKTVGYLLTQTKTKVTVMSTQSEDRGGNGGLSIPTPWITKIRVLK